MIKYVDTNKIEIPKGFFNDLNVPKFFQWLNDLPTADVQEIRRGRWITVGEGITERTVCSNCKSQKGSFMKPPFCNQCGAKMDEEE